MKIPKSTRALIECSLDPVLLLDHAGRIVESNPAAEKLLSAVRQALRSRDLSDF